MEWFKKKEKTSEKFLLRLTPSELTKLEGKAEHECNSINGIIRKAIKKFIR